MDSTRAAVTGGPVSPRGRPTTAVAIGRATAREEKSTPAAMVPRVVCDRWAVEGCVAGG